MPDWAKELVGLMSVELLTIGLLFGRLLSAGLLSLGLMSGRAVVRLANRPDGLLFVGVVSWG